MVVRKKVLSIITTKWRDFKTLLPQEYVFKNFKDESPWLEYQVSDEEWMLLRDS